VLHCWP